MKTLFRWIGRLILLCVALIAGVAFFGPREEVDLDVAFDESVFKAGVQPYFDAQEARFDDIVEGTKKRVIWAGEPEVLGYTQHHIKVLIHRTSCLKYVPLWNFKVFAISNLHG